MVSIEIHHSKVFLVLESGVVLVVRSNVRAHIFAMPGCAKAIMQGHGSIISKTIIPVKSCRECELVCADIFWRTRR